MIPSVSHIPTVSHTYRRRTKKETVIPQPSHLTQTIDAFKAINFDSMEGANTTATGLVAVQASVNIDKTTTMATSNVPSLPSFGKDNEITSYLEQIGGSNAIPSPTRVVFEPLPHEAPLPEGHTSGSAEGRSKLKELMELFTTDDIK